MKMWCQILRYSGCYSCLFCYTPPLSQNPPKPPKPLSQSLIRKLRLRLKRIKMKTWVIDDDQVLSVSLMKTINFPIYVHRVTLCCGGSAENVFSGSDLETAGAFWGAHICFSVSNITEGQRARGAERSSKQRIQRLNHLPRLCFFAKLKTSSANWCSRWEVAPRRPYSIACCFYWP